MAYIQTVCGPAAAETLGHSQIHEHIFVRHTPMADIPLCSWTTLTALWRS